MALRSERRLADLVEDGMVDAFTGCHPDAEADAPGDLAHHCRDVDVLGDQRRGDRLVAAADVEADAGGRDVALVGDRAADRLRVARVMVGTEDAEVRVARVHAPLELVERPLVDRAERPDLAHLPTLEGRTRGEL